MAAITTITALKSPAATLVRTGTAQANTGQTDWVSIPPGKFTYGVISLNMTASGGSSPGPTLVHLFTVDPLARNDTNKVQLLTATVGLTNTGLHITEIGPGIKGGTDVTN